MNTFSSSTEIYSLLKDKEYNVIGIDGINGAGKSYLAREISNRLNNTHINLDDYLIKDRKGFVPYIRYDVLRSAINKSEKPIIIDGVCLLAILNELDIKADLMIYIKRVADYGLWYDYDLCDVDGNIEEFIKKEKEDLRLFAKAEVQLEGSDIDPDSVEYSALTEEIIRYHYKYKPHHKADIIYENKKENEMIG